MSNYQIGAVVYLRSGSPRMTIVRFFDSPPDRDGVTLPMAEVAYSVYGEHNVVRHEFPVQALDVKSLPPVSAPAPQPAVAPWEKTNAQQNTEAAPDDGSGSPRSEVREAAGDTPESRERVQQG